jgi:hypothetical protein
LLAAVGLLFFTLAWLAHRGFAAARGRSDWRESFLWAAVAWGVVLVAITEIAGGLGVFRRGPVLVLWLLASAGAGLLLATQKRQPRGLGASGEASRELESGALWAGVAAVLLLVGVTALAAPPNTWDALTYHLPRAAHWAQNGRVAFYPTPILRQLDLPPFAEYAIAQLLALSGSDRLANLVQWFALAGSAVASSLVARELGAGSRSQAGAAVFAVTAPMAVLQGSSSQNDLVAGFWLLGVAFFLLLSLKGNVSLAPLGFAACLGLALLTKGTSYLFAAPLVVWFAVVLTRRGTGARRPALLGALLVLALNLPHWSRNLSLFGSPLGTGHGVLNARAGAAALLSNAVRNLAIHLATPFPAANRGVEEAVAGFHRLLGIGASDTATTWRGATFHVPPVAPGAAPADGEEALYGMLHEDSAGNPLHLLLLLAALGAALSASARRRLPSAPAYLAALAAAFLLFCGALRWQPWNSRLELPLFLLGAPFAAAVLLPRSSRFAVLLPVVSLAAALPWELSNATRPLLGPDSVLTTPRFEQYFANRPGLLSPSLGVARVIARNSCDRVGLILGPDDGEHLFRVAIEREAKSPVRLEHVFVRNRSASLASGSHPAAFEPCALLSTVPYGPRSAGEEVHRFGWAGGAVTVRLPRARAPNPRR